MEGGILGGFLILDSIFFLPQKKPISPIIYDAAGEILSIHPNEEDDYCLPVSLKEIPPDFLARLIQFEDQRFFSHWGVDPWAVIRSLKQLIANGKVISGASTITMQVARLLTPKTPRTILQKLKEMFRSFQLEWHFSKDEILEMYLTLAPYGGNRRSITLGAQYYFQKPLNKTNLIEQLILISIPQSPNRYCPVKHFLRTRERIQKLGERFHAKGLITQEALDRISQYQMPSTPFVFPRLAPHLAFDKNYRGGYLL